MLAVETEDGYELLAENPLVAVEKPNGVARRSALALSWLA
jgi:hypothetical protein